MAHVKLKQETYTIKLQRSRWGLTVLSKQIISVESAAVRPPGIFRACRTSNADMTWVCLRVKGPQVS